MGMALVGWPGGSWQSTATLVGLSAAIYAALLWLGIVLWTYKDIRDRSQSLFFHVLAVLLVFMFSIPGLFLYLLLRPRATLAEAYSRALEEEALLQELEGQDACPYCRRRTGPDFLFCPYCRTRLREPCHSCSRPLHHGWAICPYCGSERETVVAAAPPEPAPHEPMVDTPKPVPKPVPIEVGADSPDVPEAIKGLELS
ncbi:MAG TPA: zinc ribbon domain-containing protein [Dehalococcoidia bacterium]|nr:zinc ribbon domain-containing protein [Dehalococcoidia bacterium]